MNKTMRIEAGLITAASVFFCASSAYAIDWHLGATYVDWNGPSNGASLPSGNTGFGALLEGSQGSRFFRAVGRVHLEYSQSSSTFLDNGTARTGLSYRYYGLILGAGGRVNLIPGSTFRLYISGLGNIGMTAISLPSDSTYVNLSSSSAAPGLGYEYHAGIESGSMFIEAGRRVLRADLQGQSPFGLDAWLFSGGYSW